MTIEQIIKLSDIGFTADEIKQLSNSGNADPAGDPKPVEPAGETKDFSEAVNALMKEISGLKKTIQATNILNSNAGQEKPESVDTILKSFMKGNEK